MLPPPPINVWSSRARLTSVRRRRSAALKAASSKVGSSGSIAMCARRGGMPVPSSPLSSTARPPKVRWSTKRSSRPPSVNLRRARKCVSSGADGFSTSNCPLMPRCATSARPDGLPSASASGSHRYLPRRCASVKVRPVSASTKWSMPSRCRRTARGWWTSTAATVRPATHWARPRRTTSTSGSSGTTSGLGQGSPGRLGGFLLGGLLGAAAAGAVHGAGVGDGSGESLGVVGAGVLDQVAGGTESPGSAQFLEAGLPVQAGAAGGRFGQQRVEQAVHERSGRVQATTEVHRPDQRLEGVGEDRVLLPAAGRLLPTAQEQVRADAAVTEPARDLGEGRHVDHRRPQLRQLALGEVRLAAVELVGDDQAEHRVAQELQALVGGQAAVLVRERPVGQRQTEQPVGQLDAQGVVQPTGSLLSVRGPTRCEWASSSYGGAVHDGAQRRGLRQREPDGRRTDRSSRTPGAGASTGRRRGSGTATGSARRPSTSSGGHACWSGTSSASGQPRSVLLSGGDLVGGARRGSVRSAELLGEPGPASVHDLVVVVGREVVQPLAAVDAEPSAVLGADRRQRQVEDDGVAGQRGEGEEGALDAAGPGLLPGGLGRGAPAGGEPPPGEGEGGPHR